MIEDPARYRPPVTQRGKLSLRIGKRARLAVRVEVTSGGLLAIGGLVSSILLSTAVLVGAATGTPRRRQAKLEGRDAIQR